ncbi:hypothetical protein CIP107532_01950 [Corynebacterium diphtheriae]|nr:hypothetical protein CIP107532_01950 [Corynebacterium diphtheriae]CAB0660090.1 hypothetical protein CIP107562_01773 [Corynebacterium diphtheriae]CAB0734674.1 hypothetical protein FRC0119_00337 [Corynebacterium diphtheriae]CAB0824079.1 hypothetical protein FRC0290_01744 [Corynebacterium diphtheriae]CAB0846200.1 hypothetical protein FRC0376_00302 [Corynebacterium diphtheriae]
MANTDIQAAVTRALESQSWWLRRKDSLTSGAGLVLHFANLIVTMLGDTNPWVNVVVAVVIGVAQLIIHAGTKGAITPSMVTRIDNAAPTPPVFDLDQARDQLAAPSE